METHKQAGVINHFSALSRFGLCAPKYIGPCPLEYLVTHSLGITTFGGFVRFAPYESIASVAPIRKTTRIAMYAMSIAFVLSVRFAPL